MRKLKRSTNYIKCIGINFEVFRKHGTDTQETMTNQVVCMVIMALGHSQMSNQHQISDLLLWFGVDLP